MSEQQSGVYKELNTDMRNGLKHIYKQISSVSKEDAQAVASGELFTEASDQLNEVVKATESAAMNIMDIVEKQLEQTDNTAALLDSLDGKMDATALTQLRENNSKLAADLTSVLTTLSFQDITGQRIKRVMAAMSAIENSVVELYLSSGVAMEVAEKNPDKSADMIRAEAQKVVDEYGEVRKGDSKLKGPSKEGVSQKAIDDMLAQLGL